MMARIKGLNRGRQGLFMNVMTEAEFEAKEMAESQVLCLVQLQAHKCWSSYDRLCPTRNVEMIGLRTIIPIPKDHIPQQGYIRNI